MLLNESINFTVSCSIEFWQWFTIGLRYVEYARWSEPNQSFSPLLGWHSVVFTVPVFDGMGYLTALAKTGLSGHLNYSDRNIVEKLFQTVTLWIGRFHETWNGSQPALGAWLTAYVYYYNHLRSHQALDNQSPVEAAALS